MIDPIIRTEILRRLAAIEKPGDVRVLYAVESGSRAWGFPSRDSDYDVRFIFIRPPEWYLSIDLESRRDVIEQPIVDDIDLGGWDIRKAFRLFAKSNPPLLEWLSSPIRYTVDSESPMNFGARCRPTIRLRQSPLLAWRAATSASTCAGETVWVKKHFYVPASACDPVAGTAVGSVPMSFTDLFATVEDDALLAAIENRQRKIAGEELIVVRRFPRSAPSSRPSSVGSTKCSFRSSRRSRRSMRSTCCFGGR
ncbi:MAG: nucleotidyltransferase domain-containing protein [Blastocatellia bacterium]|nr:nucleotidyltransferase domain-containing protein [Blastocatellia bacterium]